MYIQTSVLTANNGWTNIGSLRSGDIVYNSMGCQTEVIGVSENFIADKTYKISFNTGETFLCGPCQSWKTLTSLETHQNLRRDPLWQEKRRTKRPSRAIENPKRPAQSTAAKLSNSLRQHNYLEKNIPRFRTVEEILATLLVRETRANHSLEVTSAIESQNIKLTIDPYTLGLFLGDGAAISTMIIMEIRDWAKIEHLIPYKIIFQKKEGKTQNLYNRRFEGLRQDLQKVLTQEYYISPKGRKTKKFKKIIPNCIFTTSVEDRFNLLKGLMDTDGTADKSKGTCEVSFSNYELCQGTVRLLSSLGIKTVLREKKIKHGARHYRMQFSSNMSVFNLERKKELQNLNPKQEYVGRRYVKEVIVTEPCEMKVINLSNEQDGMLLGDTLIPSKPTKLIGKN